MASQDIYNTIKISDDLITAGQPTADQIRALAQEGFSNVVNLATASSSRTLDGEDDLVRSLGMAYYHIPVEWADPKESDWAAFERIMLALPSGKTLIHCAANFRVTAFYSLYAQKHLGWTQAQAEQFRAPIWQGSSYPVWQEFIARIQAQITSP